jgi:hypothetical protein
MILTHHRSQCTKEVEPTEIGRIFAVVALGQAIVPLISNPLFGGIYKATLRSDLDSILRLLNFFLAIFRKLQPYTLTGIDLTTLGGWKLETILLDYAARA